MPHTTYTTDGSTAISSSNVYTMRELNQNTAKVIDHINATGQPAAITKHGRFVALITPLADVPVETMVFNRGALAQEVERRATDSNAAFALSSEELLQRFSAPRQEE